MVGPDDTHTTGGERYRTPAHPDMVAALGRAIWNFQSLEEMVVAILYEAGEMTLNAARSRTAGRKESALRGLSARLRSDGQPAVADLLETAADAFAVARDEHRNALGHAHPFTAGYDSEGNYLPGLAHTTATGEQRELARSASELREIAHRIEDAINPLGTARRAIRALRDSGSTVGS